MDLSLEESSNEESLSSLFRLGINEPIPGTIIRTISTLHEVDVGGITVITFEYEGEIFVYMRRFLERLGVMWNMQFAKIKDQMDAGINRYEIRKFRLPASDGSKRVVSCIPLSTFQKFLYGISFMRMPTHERRMQIIWMQDNAKRIIEDYWSLPHIDSI